jgi:uncharacterized protein YodC (DUF2158 family)
VNLARKGIPANQLKLVTHSEEFQDSREPALMIGNFVRLNSGGPRMMVVDISECGVIASWNVQEKNREQAFPRVCVHRIRD